MNSHPPPAPRGRGTGWQIAHRFERDVRETVDDGWPADESDPHAEGGTPAPGTEVRWERTVRILSANDSPDVPFELSVNPYRGCEHGCIYCYARPTHSYLNLSPGIDFETKLIAKAGAAERLREALCRPGYVPRPLNIGSATDAYQPIERTLRITRQVIEVLHEAQHPFSLVTKSGGVVRDLDLLAEMAARRQLLVFVSVTSLSNPLSRLLEPRAGSPARRLGAIRALSQAGVCVGVNIAPVIPFINEPEIEQIVEAAAAAGARSVHWTVVRLPWEVSPLFEAWLQQHFPDRAARVMARIREMRGGRNYDADFATRMKGAGAWADLIRQRVVKAGQRHGLVREAPELDYTAFRRPLREERQGRLF